MKLRSLGYRTDLFFVRFDGNVTDRGDYIVAESPTNPTFYWGNCVIFARPPGLGDFAGWQEIFKREFAHAPQVKHIALGWDSPEGEAGFIQPFVDSGFEFQPGVVLSTDRVNPPPKPNREIVIRTLSTDEEWSAAVADQVACRDPSYTEASYAVFVQGRLRRLRKMSEEGMGHWFGAFIGERMVADLGVYRDGELARFQSVGTHPDFRRRGICGTLVFEASRYALSQMGVKKLVMVADDGLHAAKIYESVGFTPVEKALGLQKRP